MLTGIHLLMISNLNVLWQSFKNWQEKAESLVKGTLQGLSLQLLSSRLKSRLFTVEASLSKTNWTTHPLLVQSNASAECTVCVSQRGFCQEADSSQSLCDRKMATESQHVWSDGRRCVRGWVEETLSFKCQRTSLSHYKMVAKMSAVWDCGL